MTHRALPLAGIRVIELGQLIAGPFAGTLLGYFGADVIKVEPPGGDPIRGWRKLDEQGTSYWWRSIGRNKRTISVDLKSQQGRELTARLIDRADVLIENFRPGTLEKWGLGPERFQTSNPGLIFTRISGYGQDGPYADRPGYASVCEGIGGLRHVNGFPGQRPARPNLSLGDTVAGLHAALGILLALFERRSSGAGQVVDVALYEAVFNLLEAVIPEFDGAGLIREPSGSTVTGIAPTNTYRCADGKFVIIGGNGDSIFKRLMATAGRPDLSEDPRLADNAGRVRHEAEIDAILDQWCRTLPSEDILDRLARNQVPGGPIYNAADMMADAHFQARGQFQQVEINGKPLKIPAMAPRLNATPGGTRWPGGRTGSHTDQILTELGLSEGERQQLHQAGIVD